MLYVFQVDSGTMMTFDMNLALESVANLKEAIWIQHRIPVDRQVLLVSGGECLDPSARVCNYQHAGTDTNPIFLFNKLHIESSPPSATGQTNTNQIHITYGSNDNLTDIDNVKDQIEGCLALPPTYMTVVSRCQLAQQLHEMAKEMSRKCEQLTHDQHLQHQGWAAVVANLEDIIISFKKRIELFQITYSAHSEEKSEQMELLNGFEDDLKILEKMEVVPCLVEGEKLSLFEWIESKDQSNPLRGFALTCKKALESLDPKVIETLEREANAVVEKGSQSSMKEIKGLEERLYGLNQLLEDTRKLVQEQFDLLQAFIQNQNRASDLRDSSILPDLCQSHQHQLLVMQKNHHQLDDIRRRCQKAKEELSVNLNTRLRWVMYIQKSLLDTSNKLTMYIERLKRIKFQVEIMSQIHNCPQIYCQAVVEVVRRKQFTSTFLEWATDLASKMDYIYKTEIERRREFGLQFDRHFLRDLFRGLDDFPKPFANQQPEFFDSHLPDLLPEDVEKLEGNFPWIRAEEDFILDLPTSSRSDESTRSNLEMENVQLKLEIESYQSELLIKDEEMCQLLTHKEDEIQKLELAQKSKDFELRNERLLTEKKTNELKLFSDKIFCLEQVVESLRLDLLKQMEKEREKEVMLEHLKLDHQHELRNLTEELNNENEETVNTIKAKCKAEFEGLKSRFKFMSSIEQKSPVESVDVHVKQNDHISISTSFRSLDLHDRQPKPEDLLSELNRVVDSIQKILPDGLSPFSVRKILKKLEGKSSIGLQRTRNISEGGQRLSVEIEDEPSSGIMRSVFGLDTSAIDATTMLTPNSVYKELSELLMPSQRIVNAASKLVQKDRITIQSCKAGDTVFIYWNEKLRSYLVYLNTKNVHFLHTDCLKLINSSPDNPTEGFLGTVQDKEFCVARRAQNRYSVPEGFHFYRVKVNLVDILNLSSLFL